MLTSEKGTILMMSESDNESKEATPAERGTELTASQWLGKIPPSLPTSVPALNTGTPGPQGTPAPGTPGMPAPSTPAPNIAIPLQVHPQDENRVHLPQNAGNAGTPGTPAAGTPGTPAPSTPGTPAASTPVTVQPGTPKYQQQTPPPLASQIPQSTPDETEGTPDETEGTPRGPKQEVVSKTFKMPVSIFSSLEQAVNEINEDLPPHECITLHAYGLETLSNHNLIRIASESVLAGQEILQDQEERIDQLEKELVAERRQNVELKAKLAQQTYDLANKQQEVSATAAAARSATVVSVQPAAASIIPGGTSPTPENIDSLLNPEREKYNRMVTLYNEKCRHNTALTQTLVSYQQFLKGIDGIVKELSQEAQRVSWVKAEYFEWFFQVRVDQILPE